MSLSVYINKEHLHHAYCIEGDREQVQSSLLNFLEQDLGFKTKANPDFLHSSYETFSIEDSRKLKQFQQEKAFGDKKVFIISFNFITREAQNALLKIFEEPITGTHFFLITRSVHVLLPTLVSRLFVFEYKNDRYNKDVEEFISLHPAKRLEYVQKIITSKDKFEAIRFLDSLEIVFQKKAFYKKYPQFAKELIQLKKYLFLNGSSVKLVLEHVALTFPIM